MRFASFLLACVVRATATLVLPISLAPSLLAAQETGTITGRVTGPDGDGIASATVTVSGATATTRTRRDGVFRLNGVPVGRQTVTIRAIGMRPSTRQVDVSAEVPARVAVALELAPTRLSGITVIGERGGQLRAAE